MTPLLRDPASGLLLPAFLAEAAPLLLAQAWRRGMLICLALLRPAEGAAGLPRAAAQAAALLRAGDLRCLHGSDTMLLLLPDCDIGAAFERMHLLVHRMAEAGAAPAIGLAAIAPGADRLDPALAEAEAALAVARAAGGGRVVTAPMLALLSRRRGSAAPDHRGE